MQIEVFNADEIKDISGDLLENDKLKLLPASYYKSKGGRITSHPAYS